MQGFPTIKLFVDGKVVEDYQVRSQRGVLLRTLRALARSFARALCHPHLPWSSARHNGTDALLQRPAAATAVAAVGAHLLRSNLPQPVPAVDVARH